uniref:(northern house mosquito) hypothetical protein n=1 Tax=Culex pipiens TaxID=7175 RepID=A0A8D8N8A7_CULPI
MYPKEDLLAMSPESSKSNTKYFQNLFFRTPTSKSCFRVKFSFQARRASSLRQISLTFQARTGRRGRGRVQVPQLFLADSWPLATCSVTLKVCCRSWSCSELLFPKGPYDR